jgi:hypothetical protein
MLEKPTEQVDPNTVRNSCGALNKEFEIWSNAHGFDPNHPLLRHLQKFSSLGADPDVIYAACQMFGLAKFTQLQLLETKRRLADRNRRGRKELRGLFTSHPRGLLRLTETARLYTNSVISLTLALLVRKGLALPEISREDTAEIIQSALEPLANTNGTPDDWDAAIRELGTSNLPQVVGLSKVTPEVGESIKKLVSLFWPSIFLNKATKRRDDAGSIFLLVVTEHLREKTEKPGKPGKPHHGLAFDLMSALEDKLSQRKIGHAGRNAKSRVLQFKKREPQWQALRIKFDQGRANGGLPDRERSVRGACMAAQASEQARSVRGSRARHNPRAVQAEKLFLLPFRLHNVFHRHAAIGSPGIELGRHRSTTRRDLRLEKPLSRCRVRHQDRRQRARNQASPYGGRRA